MSDQLAWEAKSRPRAAAAAIGAGVLTLGGGIAVQAVYASGFPHVPVLDALREGVAGRVANPGVRAPQVRFYDEHAAVLIASAVMLAIGALLMGWALLHLFRVTKFRRPELPGVARFTAVFGAVALAVAQVVQQIAVSVDAADFAGSSTQTSAAAREVFQSDPVVATALLRQAAVLALGFAFVLLALNAMRAGLLTRFMGVLGIIVGVLFVIPVGSPIPIVPALWLVALGYLFSGRWPGGLPPAWERGEAVPWPSQQELREAREREARERPPDAEPALADAGGRQPASKKRKRKRRR